MTSWREFEAQRRLRSREFFDRHQRLRILRVILWLLIFLPLGVTVALLDYGDFFGLAPGAQRYQAALGTVIVVGVAVLAIVAALGVSRWREEARATEIFTAIGLIAVPVAWAFVAACVLDLKADAPTCSSRALDVVFAATAWMLAWIMAGPLVDFMRAQRLR